MSREVSALTLADLDRADEILVAAYNLPNSRKPELLRYLQLQPDGWRLVIDNGVPVAAGGIVNYGPFSYVGLIGVAPAMQRRGLGHFLMEDLLTWAREQDCPTVLLDATAGGAQLYTGLNFVEDDKTVLLSLSEHIPTHHPAEVYTLREQDISELVAFDAHFFGAKRAHVLQALFHEFPQRAFVTRDKLGQISGYLFAQTRTLGPWIASSPQEAEQLVSAALSLPSPETPLNVILSASNIAALLLLERYGFRQQRLLSHMRLGKPADYRQRSRIYGQASFALG